MAKTSHLRNGRLNHYEGWSSQNEDVGNMAKASHLRNRRLIPWRRLVSSETGGLNHGKG
jgi:hypothetical protein